MIGIRADANSKIGTGHVMRCLAIASALKKCGQQVCFLLADDAAAELLDSRGQAYHILHTDYRAMEAELPKLKEWLAEQKASCLLIDSYFVTPGYLEQVRALARTAYVDDMNSFPYPVDMLINYNIYGDGIPYQEQMSKEEEGKNGINAQMFLLGTSYAPLREEFQSTAYSVREELRNVLITTGGSDTYYLAGQILEKALQNERTKDLHFHVVSGAFNQNLPALKGMEKLHSNVHIHQKVIKMAELMQECDAAITAGGSTMYELCAVGVPIICFSFVDNQEQIVRTFLQKGYVCFGGDYLTQGEQLFDSIAEQLAVLADEKSIREAYSEKERKLVDGCGAMRIAQALCQLGNR